MMAPLALYTTVYPGVERHLASWYRSVLAQSDHGFDLWVGVDSLPVNRLRSLLGEDREIRWVEGGPGDSPARIRQLAFERLVERYEGVILVDSDDLLEADRVGAARRALRRSHLNACAMRLVDEDGADLHRVMRPAEPIRAADELPRRNVFGLSNTAYRTELLRECLPIPEKCMLVDWFLATRAWARGASLTFDPVPHMIYRQRAASIARLLPPFSASQVLAATERVLDHYRLVLGQVPELRGHRRKRVDEARRRTARFSDTITASPETLARYVTALNRLPAEHVWWDLVAHPELETSWKG